ncbi:MAG: hypothetical protein KAQ99_02295 [Candidatus Aureabacteria bacterium]|nr:hypothetical protein [Candidatus Auribacterota bacterium]
MKTIIRSGSCNMCGNCCRLTGDGNAFVKGPTDDCQWLDITSISNEMPCEILGEEKGGKTLEELKAVYGEALINAYENMGCADRFDCPMPVHFGYRPETPTEKWADGWDAHLAFVMANFEDWKKLTSCAYSFAIVEV